ncbi:MAG: hypothetical protein LBG44_05845 [Gemmatimonadota bacterium]|nr:hypothetical protein [Gemmatimonadota bacterium]
MGNEDRDFRSGPGEGSSIDPHGASDRGAKSVSKVSGEQRKRWIENELDKLQSRLEHVAKELSDDRGLSERWNELQGGSRRAFGNAKEAVRKKGEKRAPSITGFRKPIGQIDPAPDSGNRELSP